MNERGYGGNTEDRWASKVHSRLFWIFYQKKMLSNTLTVFSSVLCRLWIRSKSPRNTPNPTGFLILLLLVVSMQFCQLSIRSWTRSSGNLQWHFDIALPPERTARTLTFYHLSLRNNESIKNPYGSVTKITSICSSSMPKRLFLCQGWTAPAAPLNLKQRGSHHKFYNPKIPSPRVPIFWVTRVLLPCCWYLQPYILNWIIPLPHCQYQNWEQKGYTQFTSYPNSQPQTSILEKAPNKTLHLHSPNTQHSFPI